MTQRNSFLKFSALCVMAWIFSPEAHAIKVTCGQFKIVKGQVTFKERPQSPSFIPAGPNRKVCAGGSIKTAADSRAMIMMPGGDEIHVSPSSELVLQDIARDEDTSKKKVLIHLIYGKIRSNVQKNSYGNEPDAQFRVKTKTAVAGVRGTQFLTGFDSETQKSEIVTIEGKVEVGQPVGNGFDFKNSVFVEAGQKTESFSNSVPTTPQEVPKQELEKIEKTTTASTPSPNEGLSSEPGKKEATANEPKKEGPVEDSGKTKEPKSADANRAEGDRNNGNKGNAGAGGSGSASAPVKGGVAGAVGGTSASNDSTKDSARDSGRDSARDSTRDTGRDLAKDGGRETTRGEPSRDLAKDTGRGVENKPPQAGVPADSNRMPSAVSPKLPSMITNEDLGKAPNAPIVGNTPSIPLVGAPNLIPLPPPTICNFCTERLVNGDAKVDIKVNIQN